MRRCGTSRDLDQETRPSGLLALQACLTDAAILGAAAVTGGAVLLSWAIRHAVGAAVHILAYIGAGLLASAALVLLIVLWRSLGEFSTSVHLPSIKIGSVKWDTEMGEDRSRDHDDA